MENRGFEIVILCGGSATRMGKLALNQQKCMLKVEGRPILEHLLEQIVSAFGRGRIILVIGYRGQDICDYFGEHYKGLQLSYTRESIMGTRLALLAAEDFIKGEHFLSIDGDMIIKGSELANLVNLKRSNLLGIILLSAKPETAPTHGLAVMESQRVLKIDWPPTQSISGSHTFRLMDIGFYSRRLFKHLKAYNVSTISEVLKNSVEKGEIIEGRIYANTWFHFMIPEDLRVSIKF